MTISTNLRNQVMMLDNFTCVYCGYQGSDVSVDHFIPSSKGGPDVVDNLFTSCQPCNSKKKDRPIWIAGMILAYGRFGQKPKQNQVKPSRGISAVSRERRKPSGLITEDHLRITGAITAFRNGRRVPSILHGRLMAAKCHASLSDIARSLFPSSPWYSYTQAEREALLYVARYLRDGAPIPGAAEWNPARDLAEAL